MHPTFQIGLEVKIVRKIFAGWVGARRSETFVLVGGGSCSWGRIFMGEGEVSDNFKAKT